MKQKKVAVMIYDNYCNFEFAILLEALFLEGVKIDIFGVEKKHYRSEEGILTMAEQAIVDCDVDAYDALILTGAMDEKFEVMHNEALLKIVREFDAKKKVIGAISIGPLILLKSGIMKERPFMCGASKEGLIEEGFTMEDMKDMLEWETCEKEYDTLKYVCSDNVITSVCYGYREWAMKICEMIEVKIYPMSYGLNRDWKKNIQD